MYHHHGTGKMIATLFNAGFLLVIGLGVLISQD